VRIFCSFDPVKVSGSQSRAYSIVKSLTSNFFLFIVLVSSTEFNQLLRLPVLFEHFSEHKASNSGISFVDFLDMHYSGNDLDDKDQERDKQLPFKSYGGSAILLLPTIPVKIQSLEFNWYTRSSRQHIFYIIPDLLRSYTESIWQPPKYC